MRHILLLALAVTCLTAADATGRWIGTLNIPTADGRERAEPALLVLKQEGEKLSGTAGPNVGERHEIQNGKAENGNLTFEVPADGLIMKFTLKLQGDEIKGEIMRERNGQTQRAKLAVKREK